MPDSPWDEFSGNGFLRDSRGQPEEQLERRSDGTEWITEYPDNQWVGRYDPITNMTRVVYGNFVGYGNLLTTLLRRR